MNNVPTNPTQRSTMSQTDQTKDCTNICNILNNRIDFIKGMINMPENIGIKGITRAEHYIESLEHLKSELEDDKICKCDIKK